jgi:hypothetical protein
MAIITCIRPHQKIDPLWLAYFIVTLVYFLALLLYSIIPVGLYYRQFRQLPTLNRWTRLGISISIALKVIGYAIAIVIGFMIPPSDIVAMHVSGICLLEFTSYVTATCYSLLLLFWLSVCVQLLPLTYVPRFRVMRIVSIVYNILIYIVFITVVAVNTRTYPSESIMAHVRNIANGVSAMARDFMLVLIFLIFLIHLKLSLRDNAQSGEMIDERTLFRFSLMLGVALLLRGIVSLIQGLVYQNQERGTDCDTEFGVMCLLQEIILEGGPFIVLIRTNTRYLVEQHQYAERASSRLNSSAID